MPSPTEITVARALRLVGTPDAPLFVDVRTDEDFDDDPRLIPGAVRYAFDDMAGLAASIQATTGPTSRQPSARQHLVIYCQRGLKISQGAAAVLRDRGLRAESLEGGQFAWRDAGAPSVDGHALPSDADGPLSLWVTRHRPKIDRIACPWLIRRFVDRRARFLFVAPSEVLPVAERFGATPFDIEGVKFSHRGDRCSFDTFLEVLGLETEALARLATIVRAADTDRHELAPEAAGLLAASLGLSRMYRDDLAQLEAGMGLYDAFYRWARDASDEGHDWPAASNHASATV